MMHVHLERDEVSALLEQQAFAAPKWRKYLFWSQLALLTLTSGYGLHLYLQESTFSRQPSLIHWQQGSPNAQNDPELFRCLQAWGELRGLQPAVQLMISTTPDVWYLAWISADQCLNFSMKGNVQELCR
jgi:hypothetical protein